MTRSERRSGRGLACSPIGLSTRIPPLPSLPGTRTPWPTTSSSQPKPRASTLSRPLHGTQAALVPLRLSARVRAGAAILRLYVPTSPCLVRGLLVGEEQAAPKWIPGFGSNAASFRLPPPRSLCLSSPLLSRQPQRSETASLLPSHHAGPAARRQHRKLCCLLPRPLPTQRD